MILDLMESLAWFTTSILANIIVVGLLIALLVIMLGVPWQFFVNKKIGKRMMTHGGILLAVMVTLSQMQLHTTPTTFEDVGALGLATIRTNWFTDMWRSVMNFLVQVSSYLGAGMILFGAILFFARGKSGVQMMLVGAVLFVLTGLIGGGGLMTIITNIFSGFGELNIFS
ncbi:MAG: hypothetical protein ACTSUE_12460 [Promethearchaeota archaeon]